jgi:hypothetical protein
VSRAALPAPEVTEPASPALRMLLVLSVAAQFGHAMFETTFALYSESGMALYGAMGRPRSGSPSWFAGS